MATWPTTLPAPMAQGYGIDPVDPVIRTDMEVGAARPPPHRRAAGQGFCRLGILRRRAADLPRMVRRRRHRRRRRLGLVLYIAADDRQGRQHHRGGALHWAVQGGIHGRRSLAGHA